MCAIAEALLSRSLEELNLPLGLKRDLSFMWVAVIAETTNCIPATLILNFLPLKVLA